MPKSKKELGSQIAGNIRLLAALIARKPAKYTPDWARTPEESFFLYTKTSTVDLVHSFNEGFIAEGWPFPAYVNLEQEIRASFKMFGNRWILLLRVISGKSGLFLQFFNAALNNPENAKSQTDRVMARYFRYHSGAILQKWKSLPLLSGKNLLVDEISATYKKRLWASCISTTLPLLDFVMRNYLNTENLNAGIQLLRDAFFTVANLRAKDLKPGYAIWTAKDDPERGNTFAKSLEEDLRLPGIYLASFFEFANRYYAWYSSTKGTPPTELNRHAVIHCASDYWTEVNAAKLLTFLDLTLRLEPYLRIIIHGESAADEILTTFKKQPSN